MSCTADPLGTWLPALPLPPGPRTRHSAIVGNEVGHVYVAAIHLEVLHAAHKMPHSDREALGQIWHPTQQQGSCQVQRPRGQKTEGFKFMGLLLPPISCY